MDDITFYSGDSRNLVITVNDSNNQPIDLTGAKIEWIVTDDTTTILSKSVNSGITISNAAEGQFTITLLATETRKFSGSYQHMGRVTLSDGSSSIVLVGTITITKSLI